MSKKNPDTTFTTEHQVPADAIQRIWGDSKFRIFITHLAKDKELAEKLKTDFKDFGVAGFVAHTSIEPALEWQSEIEFALSSMDALVALMTDGFHESRWTDQEIGFALGRKVPIVSIRLGTDPYGFIGKYQALPPSKSNSVDVLSALMKEQKMLNCFIQKMENCRSFNAGNRLAQLLPALTTMPDWALRRLISAFNDNPQIIDSFGFSGKKVREYGPGLVHYLRELTGKKYELKDGKIVETKPWYSWNL
ncbi:toll/interleukin-1 receptor domain-containing protein [Leptonema illini]|uniref:TIR domain-containing protein n=1 Tax=Leptonema illini DSM 21528 TaxID=929563 RepID=H2CGZ6_9LEPT|nr:toll/interleukin-1 receptor domain-containing protein [Leptonema illini]EHQ05838.1 hypothetical protein Lepil_1143 [Leptonema illini DSM 21528]